MTTRLTIADRGHELSGVVREGESWRAAAERTAASMTGTPVPVDLSGEVKRFAIDHDRVVALRAMTRGDLDLVTDWRAGEAVREWWGVGQEQTPEQIYEMYAERVDGLTPTRMWMVEVNGRSVGFVQDYRIRDYPDYAVLAPDPDAIGVDYAIGADQWRGRGLGPAILWAWMKRTHSRVADATTFFAAPDHRNAASLRVLAKAGFEQGVWFDQPQADGSVHTVVGCSLDVQRVLA
ncbi:GNAT family N-acetyltransferase [Nocardioides currus]|uniref:N-acetyltransferase n=1 Tax=Nocardioides currus TaxID=2133958 RepID=A0A2R7YRY7_9ACTN|nr:GNAT family N-acetyltransferase [Nocardioides currus]PUA79160.1 N-acetyltransferase [Nocardioides currus]